MKILVINCGSSSIKYRLFDMQDEAELARGSISRMGEAQAEIHHACASAEIRLSEQVADYEAGVGWVLRLLQKAGDSPALTDVDEIDGVGHRVVHGGTMFSDSVLVDDAVTAGIRDCFELAPLHNPPNLAGIEAAMHQLPNSPQVAVFDTAFFQTVPPHAYVYALPYEWFTDKHIRRYGFHGTSHRYVSLKAAELLDNPAPNLVTLHLGNGCSAACVRGGKAIDHSMGMTPLAGLAMGTRCGDVDPAVIFQLQRDGVELSEIEDAMVNRSGLLGISGVSSDLRDVQAAADAGDERARLAIDIFVYRIRKYLGAFMTELGRCDAVVFTGGIGEKAANIRARVLEGLSPQGIDLDPESNDAGGRHPFRIASNQSRVQAWVIPTNEELLIARDTRDLVAILRD
jgi:acetate kinase